MRTKTSQIVIDAMLAALVAVLGYTALDMGFIKVTLESFPVVLAGLMYGPVDGMLVGGIGTFIYQILRYGFSATTALWMLPYILCGLTVGLFAGRYGFSNTKRQLILISVAAEILIFIINTFVIYLDSKIYGYYSAAYVWGSVGIRLIVAVIKAVLFGIAEPLVLTALHKYTGNRRQK